MPSGKVAPARNVTSVNPAPTVIFAFRRDKHLAATINALRANPEASDTPLIIYCDGARVESQIPDVQRVRTLARGTTGFASLRVIEREENFGLSRSIIAGVTEVCEEFGRAIVLEDDIVPSPYFLSYVNRALEKYAGDDRVLSIGCYTLDAGIPLPDTFFLPIADCWGWAVWHRSWKLYEPDGKKLLGQLRSRGLCRRFDFDGAYPYSRMLEDQVRGHNDSWAVRWCATALLENKLVLYPGRSVCANIGFDEMATHTVRDLGLGSVLTEQTVVLGDVPVEESALARHVWELAMRRIRPNLVRRALADIRSMLGRLRRSRPKPQDQRGH
jgi:hypothetical protein